ncbi:lysine exporter protein LysE/YggA [Pseudogulbenkiania sp. NH8B]|uniref:LysE family translocator n=1 Tax=Pseudogulbenkiania sp. (strain NH8B) TaxID=748280 RepID=UPI0002279990|nr:LysE family transporter [Pseudogulbenkiania sp. NH8B]BAK77967.1 lysine exporter protein LysE/YggA [Pseudogulbenkiania sp. NH8B]
MNALTTLATVLGIYLPVIVTPGPNFLVVTQTAISSSREQSIHTALGVALGSTIMACLAVTGMNFLLQRFPQIQFIIHVAGGSYLLYLAGKVWREGGKSGAESHRAIAHNSGRSFRRGLATNLTNPKALAFFSTIFATVLTPSSPVWLKVVCVVTIGLASTSWHLFLATLFASKRIQKQYSDFQGGIHVIAAAVLALFGAGLLIL